MKSDKVQFVVTLRQAKGSAEQALSTRSDAMSLARRFNAGIWCLDGLVA
jgi:bifunctional DNase/RNase